MKHLLEKLKIAIFCAFFFTQKIFIFLDLRVKVKKFKESEKMAIFSTSPEGLGGGGTNGHLVSGTSLKLFFESTFFSACHRRKF